MVLREQRAGLTRSLSRALETRLKDVLAIIDSFTDAARRLRLSKLSLGVLNLFKLGWRKVARKEQLPPPDRHWLIWLLLGGRGSGKTRAGAEWVMEQVRRGARRIALVAPTYNEAREVMIEGESGLMATAHKDERPKYQPSRRRMDFPGGATAHVFSGEDPDGLRGPQFDAAWADEFCAWAYPKETLSNLRLALRLPGPENHRGERAPPRLVMTTTPRPLPALTKLMDAPTTRISRMSTAENEKNLAPGFVTAMTDEYGGTRLGRQELLGEVLRDYDGALFTRAFMELAQWAGGEIEPDDLDEVIVALDPPAISGDGHSACGIIVAGRQNGAFGAPDKGWILHDGTARGLSPQGWAARADALAEQFGASYILAETNQGGRMVESVIRAVNPQRLVRSVNARQGKRLRAEPVAQLYEQGRIRHARAMPALEDALCQLGTRAAAPGHSDRADALVWAVHELILARGQPRVRRVF